MSQQIALRPRQMELIPHDDAKYIELEDIAKCSGHTVALDCETNGLFWWRNKLIGVGLFCPQAGVEGYITTWGQAKREQVCDAIRSWGADTTVVGHNLKFDLHFLGIDALETGWQLIDSMVLVHLMDTRNKKALEAAAAQYLGITEAKRPYKVRGRNKPIWEWPTSLIAAYCLNDCELTYRLAEKLLPVIVERDQWELMLDQMRYLAIILQIERRGFCMDEDFLERSARGLEEVIEQKKRELYDAVGYEFNWRSAQQLSKALYDDMGHPKPVNPWEGSEKMSWKSGILGEETHGTRIQTKYTSTATSAFMLMEKAQHPLGETVLDLREAAVLHDDVTKWRGLVDGNGMLHTNFRITGTRTGRLSSSDPNLQNVPGFARTRSTQSAYSGKMTREGVFNLRQAFLARPGNVLVSIDWRQMEIRMFGILAGDERMLDVLRSGGDVHGQVATDVWGTSDKVHREWAKTVSFGLLYGMTIASIQYRLDVSRAEAVAITQKYWTTFPRVKPWLAETIGLCRAYYYVTYWSGRRWYEETPLFMFKAVNALVQGGCADLFMLAVLRCWDWIQANHRGKVFINSLVHDEIVFEMDKRLVVKVVPQLQSIMEVADVFGIPFFTDVTIGYNYGSMVKIPDGEIGRWKKILQRSRDKTANP